MSFRREKVGQWSVGVSVSECVWPVLVLLCEKHRQQWQWECKQKAGSARDNMDVVR